jgi:hypothetical protein
MCLVIYINVVVKMWRAPHVAIARTSFFVCRQRQGRPDGHRKWLNGKRLRRDASSFCNRSFSKTVARPALLALPNSFDSGAGTVRDNIASCSPGDIISFVVSICAITLTSGELAIDKHLTI